VAGAGDARGCGGVRRRSGGSGYTADEELPGAGTEEARGGAGGRERERCSVAEERRPRHGSAAPLRARGAAGKLTRFSDPGPRVPLPPPMVQILLATLLCS
jgi:hypothetical protein